jgi:hypothetical protein
MKSLKITIIFLLVFVSIQRSAQAELSHIQTLACETILCLSSAVQPAECNPALSYFYGIKGDKISDTLDLRRAFLNKCPDSSAQGMPSLINAIVNYSSPFCTLERLNHNLVEVRILVKHGRFRYNAKTIKVVNPELPAACRNYYNALINHEYTAYTQLSYIGTDLGYKREDDDGNEFYVIYADSTGEQNQIAATLSDNHWEWH